MNEQGGPNHVGNYCDAPILFDRRTQTVIQNSSYYVIGHFSKFIVPGSQRIALTTALPSGVQGVAYQRPDKQVVVVLLNTTNASVQFTHGQSDKKMMIELNEKSIMTIILDEKQPR